MVPQPVWTDRPSESKSFADTSIRTHPDKPAEPLPFLKNTSGRFWKQPHNATARAQAGKKDKAQASNAFAKREEIRKRDEAVKKLERCVSTAGV